MPGTQLGHELKQSGAIKQGKYEKAEVVRERRANLKALEGDPVGEVTEVTPGTVGKVSIQSQPVERSEAEAGFV